ncbi:MAG: hypothetical protein Q7T50_02790 [Candidatus Magasanikbacteria bacterium]|nr:hypothetical protein [Candidatus Magasanikbacteria bacterium]
MPELKKIIEMHGVIERLGTDSTVKEKLEAIIYALNIDGYNATLETIVLSEVAKRIELFAEAEVESFAPLIIHPGMFKRQDSVLTGGRRLLTGAAEVIGFALAYSGLETRIMLSQELEEYVLVAIL